MPSELTAMTSLDIKVGILCYLTEEIITDTLDTFARNVINNVQTTINKAILPRRFISFLTKKVCFQ